MFTIYHKRGREFMQTTPVVDYESAKEFCRRFVSPVPTEVRHAVATVHEGATGRRCFQVQHRYGQRKPVISEYEWEQ